MKRERRKIHLPNGDPYVSGGWGKTECGRTITEKLLVETEKGRDHATCEVCKSIYDFGVLCR